MYLFSSNLFYNIKNRDSNKEGSELDYSEISDYTINEFSFDDFFDRYNIIEDIRKVNIFIGPNNSAKSRFLRKIFMSQIYGIDLKEKYYNIYKRYEHIFSTSLETIDPKYKKQFNKIFQNLLIPVFVHGKLSDIQKIGDMLYGQELLCYYTRSKKIDESIIKSNRFNSLINHNYFGNINDLNQYMQRYSFDINLYIPLQRGLKDLNKYSIERSKSILKSEAIKGELYYNLVNYDEDILLQRVKEEYFSPKIIHSSDNTQVNTKSFVFTGYQLFDELRNHLLGEYKERELVKAFEEFLSITFFDSKMVSVTPNEKEKIIKIKIDSEERAIYDWGDGIQSLMILGWPLFKYREQKLALFIEEPEILLHPGYLRRYFEYVINKCENVTLFCTTHSNHLIDLKLDYEEVNIFQFSKSSSEKFSIKSMDDKSTEILDSLGVRYSSVLLSNCLIWVEGATDRLYINQYLKLYQDFLLTNKKIKLYKENIHYSFAMFGGDQIVHYSFMENELSDVIDYIKINGNSILIHDSDGVKENNGKFELYGKQTSKTKSKLERFISIRENIADQFIITPGREIENSLTKDIIEKVIGISEEDKETFHGGRKDITFKWGYLQNYIDEGKSRIASFQMNEDTIDSREVKNKPLNAKVKFAKKACDFMNDKDYTFEDLDSDTQKFTIIIYEWIVKFNS